MNPSSQYQLNEAQQKAVEHAMGPVLVFAGAGTGKTLTLTHRVAWLMRQGINPHRIMLLTFTNKAANEMLERVCRITNQPALLRWGGTFHRIANKLLRLNAQHVGYSSSFTILDEDDALRLVRGITKQIDPPRGMRPPTPEAVRRLLSLSANTHRPISELVEQSFGFAGDQLSEWVQSAGSKYEEEKRRMDSMDFDDLLGLWDTLLKHSTVGERLRQSFDVICVDEYQDTNPLQRSILLGLAKNHQNIFVVGDDAQSIYSFRGATIDNILSFTNDFPTASTVVLNENYRSTNAILTFANNIIRSNVRQYQKELLSTREGLSKPVLKLFEDKQEEAQGIIDAIRSLEGKGVPLSDTCVLARSIAHSLELQLACEKDGMPYQVRGGMRFFDQAHIKDVIAFLKLIYKPQDELAFRRVIELCGRIGPAASTRLYESFRAVAPNDRFSTLLALAQQTRSEDLIALATLLTQLPTDAQATDIMTAFLEQWYSKRIHGFYDEHQDRLDDCRELTAFAKQFSDPHELLATLTLSERSQKESSNVSEPMLLISTIHQAKGLEFPSVIVIGLVDGQFPHHKAFDDPKQFEEERRLFYVACTRAKEYLLLTAPTLFYPSQFITERDPSTLEGHQHASFEDAFEEPSIDMGDEKMGTLDRVLGSMRREKRRW